ncbi:hypothetical protein TrST_g1079 [Triparma strigata]|uniref:Peroxin-12 n=1 Tax=Triparma strigata TaxID=1606541 RepID=A0A9W7C847_9STRA|nr:hypothetical protein TrST_g1079 [Triparma strigata]
MDRWITAIDPLSPLPSFFELHVCNVISKSLQDVVTTYSVKGSTMLYEAIHAHTQRQVVTTNDATSDDEDDTTADTRLQLVELIGEYMGLLALFAAELRSSLNNSASLAETMYGCTRSEIRVENNVKIMAHVSRQTRVKYTVAKWTIKLLSRVAKRKYEQYEQRETNEANPNANEAIPNSAPNRRIRIPTLDQMSRIDSAKKLFRFLYPYLNFTAEGVAFGYQWSYLFGLTVHFSPLLHLANQTVRRLTLNDVRRKKLLSQRVPRPPRSEKLTKALSIAKKGAAVAASIFLLAGWISNARSSLLAARSSSGVGGGASTLPPPTSSLTLLPLSLRNRLSSNSNLCPICSRPRVNPTASPTGYVYCYRCILMHVRENGTDPIMRSTVEEGQLIHLYENEEG